MNSVTTSRIPGATGLIAGFLGLGALAWGPCARTPPSPSLPGTRSHPPGIERAADNSRPFLTLPANWMGVTCVDFSPDGDVIVTTGVAGNVSLWDGQTALPLGTVTPNDQYSSAAFMADSETIKIMSFDGSVYTWDTRSEHWVAFACSVAGRSLTMTEWRDAFGDRPYAKTCP